jgi:predicted transcriptional regulator
MAVIKAAPKPPKSTNLQVRIEEETKVKLDHYAEFIDSSQAYVVGEALKLLFDKDREFKTWLDAQSTNEDLSQTRGGRPYRPVNEHEN